MLTKLKPKSEFSRNVLTLMTGTTIAQAIPIAISPILTRIYTPKDFGVFALFVAVVGFISVMSSARYEQAVIVAEKDEDAMNIFALGFILLSFFSILTELIIVFFKNFISSVLNSDEFSQWLYIIPLTVFFVGLFNLLTNYNNRIKQYKDIANAVVTKSLVLVMVQLVIGLLNYGVYGLIWGQMLSQLFANIRLLKNIFHDKLLLSTINKVKIFAMAKKYNNFPKYNMPHAMIGTLTSNLPIYIFTPFFGSVVVGYYSLALMIIFTPLMILANATARVYNQKVSELYNQKQDTYNFTLNVIKSLLKKILLPFILFVIFAPNIFAFIFGDAWMEAGIYTQILSGYLILNVIVSTVAYIPSLLGLQKKALMIAILHVIIVSIALYFFSLNNNIYFALIALSLINSVVLIYNLFWMLSTLKERN
jgi:O-antigen/teichoic acid export membrane protein